MNERDDHYAMAVSLLHELEGPFKEALSDEACNRLLARAQVHATLATVESDVAFSGERRSYLSRFAVDA